MTAALRRRRMVQTQLVARGIQDPSVLDAMGTVPREAFIAPSLAPLAYADGPLPIREGQTISQPYVVALMLEALALQPTDRVLEVGTGSGYAAAVLASVVREVWSVERHPILAEEAARQLAKLGYANVVVRCGDGSNGWPERAPFDAIVVAAGGPELPRALLDELALGGRLVMPVGSGPENQELVRITRTEAGGFVRESLGGVRFVPLVGRAGFSERATRNWPVDDAG